jgi:hypothetical protein|tara:strand:- start:2102 stop:2293 length:192 start_codon:yes stop_codon:yes gene_type:complete
MKSLNIKSREINYNDQDFQRFNQSFERIKFNRIPLIAILIFPKKLSAKLFIRMMSSGLDAVDI